MLDQQLEALEEQLVLAEDELAEADHESMALQVGSRGRALPPVTPAHSDLRALRRTN